MDGPDDWNAGRSRSIDLIAWDRLDQNDFLVVLDLPVERPYDGGPRRIVLDAVAFVNGIPFAVIASSAGTAAIRDAVDRLRSWTGERPFVPDTSVPGFFRYVQLLVAADTLDARLGTVTSLPEYFAEWKTTAPVAEPEVAAELGVTNPLTGLERLVAGALRPSNCLDLVRVFSLFTQAGGRDTRIVARHQQFRAVLAMTHRLEHGASPQDRGGLLWHTQGSGKTLTMVFLIKKMRTLTALRGFKIAIVSDRRDLKDQLTPVLRLSGEAPSVAMDSATARSLLATDGPGVIQLMIQQARRDDSHRDRELTGLTDDPENVEFTASVLNESARILLLVDEAHRTQSGKFHSRLSSSLPSAAKIGLTGTPIIRCRKRTTYEIFGAEIDRYTLVESVEDGATVPIRYEGRHAFAEVIDKVALDTAFEEEIGGGHALVSLRETLESRELIADKARDMLAHWVRNVLTNGFKAQVVAMSRLAVTRYGEALENARDELVDATLAYQTTGIAPRGYDETLLAITERFLPLIRRIAFAPVISHDSDDPAAWSRWTSEEARSANVRRFRQPLPLPDAEPEAGRQSGDDPWSGLTPDDSFTREANRSDEPIAFVIVQSMLLTGFDVALEQVLYVDRPIREAELLQAIARTNRPAKGKPYGLVVDYVALSDHLAAALAAYDDADLAGIGEDLLASELPRLTLAARHMRGLLTELRLHDVRTDAGRSHVLQVLEDPAIRARFDAAAAELMSGLDRLLPRPEAGDYLDLAQDVGLIQWLTRRRFRDTAQARSDAYDHGTLLRDLLDRHIRSTGVTQQVPPVEITDAAFLAAVDKLRDGRDRAREFEYALRRHLDGNMESDPARARGLSRRLEELLRSFDGAWDVLAGELRTLIEQTLAPDAEILAIGLDPLTEGPIFSVIEQTLAQELRENPDQIMVIGIARELAALIRERVAPPQFDESGYLQDNLRKDLRKRIAQAGGISRAAAEPAATQIMMVVRSGLAHFR